MKLCYICATGKRVLKITTAVNVCAPRCCRRRRRRRRRAKCKTMYTTTSSCQQRLVKRLLLLLMLRERDKVVNFVRVSRRHSRRWSWRRFLRDIGGNMAANMRCPTGTARNTDLCGKFTTYSNVVAAATAIGCVQSN